MITKLLTVLLVALALPAAIAFAQAPAPVGQIVALQGAASATGADGASRALALKSPVYMKDKITTTAGSRLQIMFTDESVVSQGEKSSMTIDEYVFSPSKKSDNACSLNLAQGVFRVVTDRITKLNPERFKVKTKMATIGIRGCDLGFSLQPGEERVYVFTVQGTEEIIVDRSLSEAERQEAQARQYRGLLGVLGRLGLRRREAGTLTIDNSRMMVVLAPDQPMRLLQIPWDELNRILQSVQVEAGSARSPDAGATPLEERQGGQLGGGGFRAALAAFFRSLSAAPPAQPDPPPPGGLGEPPGSGSEQAEGEPGTGGLDGVGGNGIAAGGAAGGDAPRAFAARGAGTDWSWGVWTVGGVPDTVDFTSANTIAPTDFQTIADGAQLYDLRGRGNSAAVIVHNGARSLVEGTCDLSVQVGASVTPSWNGVFALNNSPNGTDTLAFEAEGAILADGKITGNQVTYQLHVGGQTFGRASLTGERIDGRLVGPGSGATPITGGIGSYTFSHGAATQVNGGFGADIAAP